MQKYQTSKNESLYLSKKLVKRLSYKQLILLLPTIVDKLISENRLRINDDMSEVSVSLTAAEDEHLRLNEELSEKDDISKNSISCTEVSNYVKNDSFHPRQSKYATAGESLFAAKMSDEMVKRFKSYTDKLTKKYTKILSQINKNLLAIADLASGVDANMETSKNGNGDILDGVSRTKKGGNHPSEMVLKQNLILKKMQIGYLQNNNLDFEDRKKCTFVQRSVIKSRKKCHSIITKEIGIYRGYKLKWSEGIYRRGEYWNTNKHDQIAEVQIDTGEESRRSQLAGANDHHRSKTSDSQSSINSSLDINQKGDSIGTEASQVVLLYQSQQRMDSIFTKDESLESILTASVSEKCGLLFSATIIDDSSKRNFSKECTTMSQKCHVTRRYKHNTPDSACLTIKEYKSNVSSTNMSISRRMQNRRSIPLDSNVGLSSSRVVDGRLRHGWQCTYRECLTFNVAGRPTCCNCFNSRWCRPYLCKRDTICLDCGYVNYKSRLYCKKCKFLFFRIRNTVKVMLEGCQER